MPDRVADPVDILAARLAVCSKPQPDGWRRDVLVYAMVVDAAQTREKGRPASAAVVLGTVEAAERLARREGKIDTTGRAAAPDNTSLRRSLLRLVNCGLLTRDVVTDCEHQERWSVVTLQPLPQAVEDNAAAATSLLARWIDARPRRWSTPLRRLAKRRAENAARADARRAQRNATQDLDRDQGAYPVGSSPLGGSAGKADRHGEKKDNASAHGRASTSKCTVREEGEAETAVQRLIDVVGPLLASLTAADARSEGSSTLGGATPSDAARWLRATRRWERFRHYAPGWERYDAYDLALAQARDAAAIGRLPHGWLTKDERDGVRRPRPLAVLIRHIHQVTRQLAATHREAIQRRRLHDASAASVRPPVWVQTDERGHARWRVTTNHIVLLARWLPDNDELQAAARQIAALILAHPSPLHGVVPTSVGIVAANGDYVRIGLRRARGPREDTAPRRPIRRSGRLAGSRRGNR